MRLQQDTAHPLFVLIRFISNCPVNYDPELIYYRNIVPYTYTTLLNKNNRIVQIQSFRIIPSCRSDAVNILESFKPMNHSFLGKHSRSSCYIVISFNYGSAAVYEITGYCIPVSMITAGFKRA